MTLDNSSQQIRDEDESSSVSGLKLPRGTFLKGVAAGVSLLSTGVPLAEASSSYTVGIGYSSTSDGYTAAQRAINAGGQFPAASIAGKTVVIKPNLATDKLASTGITTDPQVVRAVVDAALAAGAAQVIIGEGGVGAVPAPFSVCGYDIFNGYDPRVQLMDFGTQSYTLAPVPLGLAYGALYQPTPLHLPNVVFISVAKLKTHKNAHVTLSMKNLVGTAVPAKYQVGQVARWDLHEHGIDESIVDLNLARPVNFAVIDGIIGMEGQGPAGGTAVTMNLVIAGLNALAVDRVALQIMELPQGSVPHLAYASAKGMGPSDTSTVAIVGDSYTPYPFIPAQTPPVVWRPVVTPSTISISAGQKATIAYKLQSACSALVEIIQDNNATPSVVSIKTLQNWTAMSAGSHSIQWDGTNSTGAPVTPGTYLARIMARTAPGAANTYFYATTFVTVTA